LSLRGGAGCTQLARSASAA